MNKPIISGPLLGKWTLVPAVLKRHVVYLPGQRRPTAPRAFSDTAKSIVELAGKATAGKSGRKVECISAVRRQVFCTQSRYFILVGLTLKGLKGGFVHFTDRRVCYRPN